MNAGHEYPKEYRSQDSIASESAHPSLTCSRRWICFGSQDEIDRIIEIQGTEDIGIKTSGFGVFLQSIKYRYYPIFMIVLMMALNGMQRDIGPMLIAERKTNGRMAATALECQLRVKWPPK